MTKKGAEKGANDGAMEAVDKNIKIWLTSNVKLFLFSLLTAKAAAKVVVYTTSWEYLTSSINNEFFNFPLQEAHEDFGHIEQPPFLALRHD